MRTYSKMKEEVHFYISAKYQTRQTLTTQNFFEDLRMKLRCQQPDILLCMWVCEFVYVYVYIEFCYCKLKKELICSKYSLILASMYVFKKCVCMWYCRYMCSHMCLQIHYLVHACICRGQRTMLVVFFYCSPLRQCSH